MVQPLTVFEFRFDNEELENNFHDFFYKNNLTPLFTNEHRASPITVSYIDAQSVLKEGKGNEAGGKYYEILKDFSDYLLMASDNKSYEEAVFKILYKSRTFQGLMNNIKKIKKYIETGIEDRHLFNTWNIVWYNKDVF